MKTSKNKIALMISVVLVIGVALGSIVWYIQRQVIIPQAASTLETETPPCQAFTDLGLQCEIIEKPHASIARNKFISQSHEVGSKQLKDTLVTLTYSSGPLEAILPELRNETIQSANDILWSLGLSVVEKEIANDSGLAAGRIISTNFETGSKASNGTIIEAIVSSGKMTVPDWTGELKEKVKADATKLGLEIEFVEEEADETVGIVLSQSVTGLTNLDSKITVTISKAKEIKEIVIPEVIGLDPDEAQALLASAGFPRISMVTVERENVEKPIVVNVTPDQGSSVKTDTVIMLQVDIPKV